MGEANPYSITVKLKEKMKRTDRQIKRLETMLQINSESPILCENIKSQIAELESSRDVCGTSFQRDDFRDNTGCLLPSGHTSGHVCQNKEGKYIEWDYDWDCGCSDCRTDDINDMCIVYREVAKPTYKN